MLVCLRKMKKKQGTLKIACLNPRVQEILFLAGFNRIFIFYETEEAALRRFWYVDLNEQEKRVLDTIGSTLDIEEDRDAQKRA